MGINGMCLTERKYCGRASSIPDNNTRACEKRSGWASVGSRSDYKAKSASGSLTEELLEASIAPLQDLAHQPAHAPTRTARYDEREAMFVEAVFGRSNFDVLNNIKRAACRPGRRGIL